MPNVTSQDGTQIAFDKTGHGPALILVGGAFVDRSNLTPHAAPLSSHFSVYNYDRRGRGGSGDTQPYAIEREIEDIDSLIHEAGGAAFMFGGSSGAVLALDAAASGLNITKLALYEPPFVVDDTRPPVPADMLQQLTTLVEAGKRGDAAALYMTAGALVPAEQVQQMRSAPFWPGVEQAAQTLLYDAAIMVSFMRGKPLPAKGWASAKMPVLVADGGASPAWLRNSARALAAILPNAQYQTLAGQTHAVSPEALAPVLAQFFAA